MNKTSWLLFFLVSSRLHAGQLAVNERFAKLSGSHMWLNRTWQVESDPPNTFSSQRKKRQLKFDIEEPFWFSFCLSFSCFLHVSVSAWMTKCDAFLKSAESRQKTADAGQFCKCKKTGDETGWAVTKKQWLPSSVSMDITVFWWCYLRGSNAARYLCGPNQRQK